MANTEHSSASPDWGTPVDVIEAIRMVLGGVIDLDPFSSELFNEAVQARNIYTLKDDALSIPIWHPGTAIVNPPGDKSGELVKRCWEKLIEQYLMGQISSAVWVGFNISQLQTLQLAKVEANPMHFPFCVPSSRWCFRETTSDHQPSLFGEPDRTLVEGTQPTRTNFACLLPDRNKPWQAEVFRREFLKFGSAVVP